ncbi:hypothetical protein DPMN_101288 [Dreissena polymorpha]|uniref:Uncharacterized protein n=1 Tax=Dreissena polymorpha TaxID=45954 RepID=A0A9D4LJ60_DREPO|nr:hypothetical protein DPMN_101288 [Dreissena polymorpha]
MALYVSEPRFCVVDCLVCSPLLTGVDFHPGSTDFLVSTVSQHHDFPDFVDLEIHCKRGNRKL